MVKRRDNRPSTTHRERLLAIVDSFHGTTVTPVGPHLKLQSGKKLIGWYMEDHHGNGRIEINCRGRPGRSQELVAKDPAVYFIPSYHGKKGNIGIWLDVEGVDWDEVGQILLEAYGIANPNVVLMLKKSSVPERSAAKSKRKENST